MANSSNAVPDLLNQDGSASMATAFMMSHHAFRRDVALFGLALRRVRDGDDSRVAALREEWSNFRGALHGHHQMEDGQIFPGLAAAHAELPAVIETLTAEHQRIDPLLEQGDRLFRELPGSIDAAATLVADLSAVLDRHLPVEEEHVVPHLRAAHDFPAPATDDLLALYAQGFAWSMHGIAADVLDRVNAMLPAALVKRLPDARAAYIERCVRTWGTADTGASRTPIPDWLRSRVKATTIEDIPYYQGPNAIPGIRFHSAGRALGVTAWGMNVIEIDAGCTAYPEHDHVKDGQEEVYVVLRGSGIIDAAGGKTELAQGMLVRVDPSTRRKILPGPDGITVLALGGTPGQAYKR